MTPDSDSGLEEYAEANMPALSDPPSLAASPGTNPQLAMGDPEYLAASGGERPKPPPGEFDTGEQTPTPPGRQGDRFDEMQDRLLGESAQLREEERGFRRKAMQAQEEAYDDYGNLIKQFESRRSERPKLEQQPKEPQFNTQGMQEYMMLASVIGALAGGLVRGNSTAALNAFGGAVTGFMKGRKEEFDTNFQTWKAASQRVQMDNKARLDAYDEELKNDQIDANMKMRRIQMKAKMYDDQIMWNQADTKNIDALAMNIEKQKYQQALQDVKVQNLLLQGEKMKFNVDVMHGSVLGQDSLDLAADMYLGGNVKDVGLIGRGPAGPANLAGLWRTIQQRAADAGMSAQDLSEAKLIFNAAQSGLRTSANYEQRIGIAVESALANKPLLDKAIEKSAGTGQAWWNGLVNRWEVQTGDADYAKLVATINSFNNFYARAASGGVMTVSGSEHAREMLNPAMPKQAMKDTVAQMMKEMELERQSPGKMRAKMLEELRGKGQKPDERQIEREDQLIGARGGGRRRPAAPTDEFSGYQTPQTAPTTTSPATTAADPTVDPLGILKPHEVPTD